MYVDGGSRYETSGNNGAAYFLSQLAFSGKNAAAADSLGVFTATAGREHTVYTAKVFKNDVAKAMEVLADAVLGTKVPIDSRDQKPGRLGPRGVQFTPRHAHP